MTSKYVSPSKRRSKDISKLMMSNYQVEVGDEEGGRMYFCVKFPGPTETDYEGGVWNIRVELPSDYPYRSPSIGFVNRMYHPNVDEQSGSVCLDVINQTWSPMYDLVNIFDVFLPQLLRYPNPNDPLNSSAARLLLQNPDSYSKKVKEYVKLYANLQVTKSDSKAGTSSSSSNDSEEESKDDSCMDVDVDEDDDLSSLSDASDNDGFDLDLP